MAHHDKQSDEKKHGHGHSPLRYYLVWFALLAFTALTVFTAQQDLGGANLPLALAIATIKATLVVLFFMHLWDSEGVMKLVFSVSVVFVIVLLLGVFADLLTRPSLALPTGMPPAAEETAEAAPGHPAPPPPAHGGH